MEEHRDFAQNRISGLDAKKETALLWEDLTNRLNSTSNGVTKSTDKWIKVWLALYYVYNVCIILIRILSAVVRLKKKCIVTLDYFV